VQHGAGAGAAGALTSCAGRRKISHEDPLARGSDYLIPGLSLQSDVAPNAPLYVLQALRAMNTYTATKDFEAALEWLNQWACSRSFGLGTRCAFHHSWSICYHSYFT